MIITFRDGEQTLAAYHRHTIVLIFEVVPIILFLFVLFGITAFIVSWMGDAYAPLLPLVILSALFFTNVFWIAFFKTVADFYLDAWIVTNKRVIAVEQRGFFSRTISEFELAKIQDITTSVHGIIPTLLDYGDLTVRTASEHESFVFKQVWRPAMIKDGLLKAALDLRAEEEKATLAATAQSSL